MDSTLFEQTYWQTEELIAKMYAEKDKEKLAAEPPMAMEQEYEFPNTIETFIPLTIPEGITEELFVGTNEFIVVKDTEPVEKLAVVVNGCSVLLANISGSGVALIHVGAKSTDDNLKFGLNELNTAMENKLGTKLENTILQAYYLNPTLLKQLEKLKEEGVIGGYEKIEEYSTQLRLDVKTGEVTFE